MAKGGIPKTLSIVENFRKTLYLEKFCYTHLDSGTKPWAGNWINPNYILNLTKFNHI